MPDLEPLELEPYHDTPSPFSNPDSPLPSSTATTSSSPQPPPKWLSLQSRSAASRLTASPLARKLFHLLRPRLTIRWLLSALTILYILTCFIRNQHLLASKLPAYTGPHAVGTIDLEIPLREPQQLSETAFKSSGQPAFELQSVLFSLYYPISDSARRATASKPPHLWIPRPISLTAEGFARFIHADNFLVRPIITFALWAIAGRIEIPAKVDAPLLAADAKPTTNNQTDNNSFPVIVFSHGTASSRTDYTHYLGELASRGHVVAAIEHRDGSCPGTTVKIIGQPDRQLTHFAEADLLSTPPMTTLQLKREQLAFRDAEIFETINVLASINAGAGNAIFTNNSRHEGVALHEWKDRLDMAQLTIAGHSYGATGALQALKSGESSYSSPAAVGGIILDPGKSSGELNADVNTPILVIHSDSWSRKRTVFFGRPHFDTVRDLVDDVLNRTGAAWFLTSLGTSHPSVTDAPLLEPLLLSWTTGARMNTKEGLEEYVNLSMEFLHFLKTTEPKGLLNEEVTHQKYDEWVNDERKQEFPDSLARLWQIHVSPHVET